MEQPKEGLWLIMTDVCNKRNDIPSDNRDKKTCETGNNIMKKRVVGNGTIEQ